MITAKNIITALFFSGLITGIILHIHNFQFYCTVTFIVIQAIIIYAEYIITNRNISNEVKLVKTTLPFTLKELLLVIPSTIILFVMGNVILKLFTTKYLVIYISIAVLSAIIQFIIIKGKETATLLIDKTNLVVNDLFVKTYNLETLNKISYDGFNDTYIAHFLNSKIIKIKKERYKEEDLNKFIAFMITKSNCNVILSDNIKTEITDATVKICGIV